MSVTETEVLAPGSTSATDQGLKKGSIGGIFYTIQFTTTEAGVSAPLTYLAAFLVCLFVAVPMLGLAFTGFESAAAVGEESRDPKRIVPRAIIGSLVLIGRTQPAARAEGVDRPCR